MSPFRKGCGRGATIVTASWGSVLRNVARGQGYCHLTLDNFLTKEKMKLFSHVRHWSYIGRRVSFIIPV